jgi:hypothetical protein
LTSGDSTFGVSSGPNSRDRTVMRKRVGTGLPFSLRRNGSSLAGRWRRILSSSASSTGTKHRPDPGAQEHQLVAQRPWHEVLADDRDLLAHAELERRDALDHRNRQTLSVAAPG